jgi:hypothetical protein
MIVDLTPTLPHPTPVRSDGWTYALQVCRCPTENVLPAWSFFCTLDEWAVTHPAQISARDQALAKILESLVALAVENEALREQIALSIPIATAQAAPPIAPALWSQSLVQTAEAALFAAAPAFVEEPDDDEEEEEEGENADEDLTDVQPGGTLPTVQAFGGAWSCSCGYNASPAWMRRHLTRKHNLDITEVNALVPPQARVRGGRPRHDALDELEAVPHPAPRSTPPPTPSSPTCADCGIAFSVRASSIGMPDYCIGCAPAHRTNGHLVEA